MCLNTWIIPSGACGDKGGSENRRPELSVTFVGIQRKVFAALAAACALGQLGSQDGASGGRMLTAEVAWDAWRS